MSRSDRRPSAIRRGRARATVSGARPWTPLLWGVLLVAGGVLTWKTVPRPGSPHEWSGPVSSSVEASAMGGMTSGIRSLGTEAPALLRMEWPAQAGAVEYRIHFQVDGQPIASPLTSPTPVFLYDLESNPFGLPDRFDWAVTAVFPNGREVTSPWRTHPAS